MDKWRTRAQQIVSYYQRTRGAGHTYQMLKGLQPKCVVVTDSGNQRNLLLNETGLRNHQIFHLETLDMMTGLDGPLVIDNYALMNLLVGLLEESDTWRKKAEALEAAKETK